MIRHSIRKACPKFIKKIFRVIKAFTMKQASPLIEPAKIKNAKLFANRKLMVQELFYKGKVLEIRTESGIFAKFLLSLAELEKLVTIDIDYSLFRLQPQENLECLKGYSHEVLPKLTEHFSLIYLDAAHDYKNVKMDLIAMAHLLRPGTVLVFNDFAIMNKDFGFYGVHRAASEFVNNNKCSIIGLAMQKNAQYDLAVLIE